MTLRMVAVLLVGALAACGGGDSSTDGAAMNAAAERARRYVGVRFGDDLPPGVAEEAYMGLSREAGDMLLLRSVSDGEGRMLWLTRPIQGAAGDRSAGWEVADAVPVPRHSENETMVFGVCSVNGVHSPEVAALVPYEPNRPRLGPARAAWRADRAAGTLETVPPAGVMCENEGAGV